MFIRSLSARLLLPMTLTALGGTILLAVAGALWIIHNNASMYAGLQQREGHLIAEGLGNAVAPELARRDYGNLESRLQQTAAASNVRSALVVDMQGQVLSYVLGPERGRPAMPVFGMRNVKPPAYSVHFIEEPHGGYLAVWHVVKVGIPIGWVRVEIWSEHYQKEMDAMQRNVWMLAMVVAVLGSLMLWIAVRQTYLRMQKREAEVADKTEFLENKAFHDELTGLPNRGLMCDRLAQAILRSTRTQQILAVCFVDLDRFKPVNDNYGHRIGDHVLVEVAQRLRSAIRAGDTVARIGGDEFLVLLTELESELDAEQAVARVALALNGPFEVDGKRIGIQASIGYALFPDDSEDQERLVNLADQAMYRIKAAGSGGVHRFCPPERLQ